MTRQECKEQFNRRYTFASISEVWQLAATLRNGKYAWPGGYPLYFITADGGCLSFDAVQQEFRQIAQAIHDNDRRCGWCVVACDVNWESEIYCDHTGELIESAYGIAE